MIETNEERLNFKQYAPRSKRGFLNVRINQEVILFSILCNKYFQRKEFCELFYDEKQKIIAVKPTHIETLKTLKITTNHNQSKRVCAKGFLNEFKISAFLSLYKTNSARNFRIKWNPKNKCFLIDLKNGV